MELISCIGEAKRPSMVNEEDMGVHRKVVGGEEESTLLSIFARVDVEEVATIEELRGELVEELAVKGGREACRCQQHAMHLHKLLQSPDRRHAYY